MKFEKVRYKNNHYAVIKIKYKNLNLPIVIDWKDFAIVRNLEKSWKCNKHGFISCTHQTDNYIKEIFMHDIIMTLKQRAEGKQKKKIPIVHINRIGLDNRRENIIYDTVNKDTNKNIKKKKRTISLPKESGISVNDIPTYVWYMKPDKTHGDRFMVDVGNIQWKTTSSKKLSLKYKLEEAKKFLRELKHTQPEIFDEYSMNGDYTKEGKELMNSYYNIVHKAGYTHISKFIPKNNTDNILKPNIRNKKELLLLKELQIPDITKKSENKKIRRTINKLPKDSDIQSNDLPKYTYYKPSNSSSGRGDYFVVDYGDKMWQSTSSKNVSTKEKYNQLLNYLNSVKKLDSTDSISTDNTDSTDSTDSISTESIESY
jgi:hypothetical protein